MLFFLLYVYKEGGSRKSRSRGFNIALKVQNTIKKDLNCISIGRMFPECSDRFGVLFFRRMRFNLFSELFMSSSLDVEGEWNFRIFDKRLVVVKTKNLTVRKVAVLDVLTNLMFAVEVPDMIAMEELIVEQEYLANLRVYTTKKLEGIDKEFGNFFQNVDVDQSAEDFIRAYWIYPSKIRFELVEVEEP